jgi:malate synthase
MQPQPTSTVRASNAQLRARVTPAQAEILSPEALELLVGLVRRHRAQRRELLRLRRQRQIGFDAGARPDFLPETFAVRASQWQVAPTPAELLDRRVEITGPVERKMIINALNSGARVFMADFEDSNAPTWDNCVDGQLNLRDAVRRTIDFDDPVRDKHYRLNDRTAVLFVRPRGLHLDEHHILVDGEPAPASHVDFSLFFYHNALELLARGSAPYFYLPKLESHLEARWWNGVFVDAQRELGIPVGTIRATVLIETMPAAFEMDEILFELRQHSAGLNCGRWDYIFSTIKTMREDAQFLLPDRSQVGMEQPFLRAYTQLLVRTCHRRGAHAMGGMAAQIPIKEDPARNAAALEKVRADKLREVRDGHDGTWVAHPGLVPVAMEIFDQYMPAPNQLDVLREDVAVSAHDLCAVPTGTRTEAGLRHNVNVGLLYLAAWLRGNGCVPLYDLMEDAATAEISRTQIWQWIHHGAQLDDGRVVDTELFRTVLSGEIERIRRGMDSKEWTASRIPEAAGLMDQLVTAPRLAEFLTIPAYAHLVSSTALKD